jgi:hypothetical protein
VWGVRREASGMELGRGGSEEWRCACSAVPSVKGGLQLASNARRLNFPSSSSSSSRAASHLEVSLASRRLLPPKPPTRTLAPATRASHRCLVAVLAGVGVCLAQTERSPTLQCSSK